MINNRQQFLNFLGIVQGAGKIISGENLLLKKFSTHQIKFLVLASDAGSSANKKFHDKASYYQIPLNDRFTSDELHHAVGNGRIVMGIADANFANCLIELNQRIKGQ